MFEEVRTARSTHHGYSQRGKETTHQSLLDFLAVRTSLILGGTLSARARLTGTRRRTAGRQMRNEGETITSEPMVGRVVDAGLFVVTEDSSSTRLSRDLRHRERLELQEKGCIVRMTLISESEYEGPGAG